MKKMLGIVVIFFYTNILLLNSVNLQGINNWIINYPENRTRFLDYEITNCTVEQTGILLDLRKGEIKIKLISMKKITYEELIEKFYFIEKNIISDNLLRTEKWNVIINEMEINFGVKNEIITKIIFKSFRVKPEEKIILELVNKIDKEVVFFYDAVKNETTYLFRFKNINLPTGNNDIFLGWNNFFTTLISWFQDKIKKKDKEALAIIVETRVYSLGEISKEIKKIRTEQEVTETKEKEKELKETEKKEIKRIEKSPEQLSLNYKRSFAIGLSGVIIFSSSWATQAFFAIPVSIFSPFGWRYSLFNLIPLAGPFINGGICLLPGYTVLTVFSVLSFLNGIIEIGSVAMIITGFIIANKYKNYKKITKINNIMPLVKITFYEENYYGEIGVKIQFN